MKKFYVVMRPRRALAANRGIYSVRRRGLVAWTRRFELAERFETVDEALAVMAAMRDVGLRAELALVCVTFVPQEGKSWEFSRKPSAAPARKASASRQPDLPT